MKFAFDKQDSYTIFSIIEPNLNSLLSPNLKSELSVLHNGGIRNVILDLSEVNFIDSSGISAILVGRRLCENVQGTFVLTGLKANVLRLLKISQLDTMLNIVPSIQESKDFVMMEELLRELGQDDDGGEGEEYEEEDEIRRH